MSTHSSEIGECSQFLFSEARLLDDSRLTEWLDLLTADIDYRVPVRTVRTRGSGLEFSDRAFYLKEDLGTLRTRVQRLSLESAWAENPPTRTRRLVANVRVEPIRNGDRTNGEEVDVGSNLAVYCYRGDTPMPKILTGERQDTLRRVDGAWQLARRTVLLDSNVLGLQSLSIFL